MSTKTKNTYSDPPLKELDPIESDSKIFTYGAWIKRGSMLVNREGLDFDDPDSVPSLYLKEYGSMDGFPYDEFFGEGNNVQKHILMSREIPTDILRSELNRRHDLNEG